MFHAKIKMSKFRVKIAFFGYFWVEFEKSHYHVWNHPRFFLRESFVRNWKSFNLRIKLPYLSIFRLKFEKEAIVTFEATSDFSKRESFVQIWGQYCFIWVFWAAISKNYSHIWNQSPQICLIAEFSAKIKILEFGIKKVLSKYLGQQF